MASAERVVRRYIRKVADVENIAPLIAGFSRALEVAEKKWSDLNAAREDSMTPVRAMVFIPGFFDTLQKYGKAHLIFWGVLQQYKITSASDRKLIEQASKEFSKNRLQRPKREVAMETLRKKLDLYRSYLEAVERIVNKGEIHNESSGTTETVGCFTTVNAGGFTPDQMADVAKVVEKASSLVKAKGFGKVCYGTIQVTNNVGGAKVLAFYALQTDEMFVRGNLKGKQSPAVGTFIHELGHRLHFKFLMSKNDQIKSLYNALKRGEDLATEEMLADKTNWPKPGDLHVEKGLVYVVSDMDLNRNHDWVVRVYLKDNPKMTGTLPLHGWLLNKGVRKKETFITPYARKDHSENFAEMFEHYIVGTLPDGLVQMFEAIVR